MLHIIPWTLILILHIRQSMYLVLTNILSTSFLMFHITFNEISTWLPIQFWYKGIDILDTCGAMICSYFGIAFLLFFIRIENAVYTSCQNSALLFINGFIFDIMNTQNNQSLVFEWKPMLPQPMLKPQGLRGFVMFPLSYSKIGWIQFRNAKEGFERDAGKKMFISWSGKHMKDWK